MNSQKLFAPLQIGVIIFCLTGCNNAKLQNQVNVKDDNTEEQIILMLKNFYTSYINEISKFPSNPQKEDSIRNKYCTTNMLKVYNIPDLDFDPIVQAQMVLKECANTINISRDKKNKDIYFISYIWPLDDKEKITIKVRVIKENKIYKVDYLFLDYPAKQNKK